MHNSCTLPIVLWLELWYYIAMESNTPTKTEVHKNENQHGKHQEVERQNGTGLHN